MSVFLFLWSGGKRESSGGSPVDADSFGRRLWRNQFDRVTRHGVQLDKLSIHVRQSRQIAARVQLGLTPAAMFHQQPARESAQNQNRREGCRQAVFDHERRQEHHARCWLVFGGRAMRFRQRETPVTSYRCFFWHTAL
jgi:hypothetical protein